jgi:hypothetical protein
VQEYVPDAASDEVGLRRKRSLDWLFDGSASLALDSIDVRCAGNSGVWSTVDIFVGAERYCDVVDIGRLGMLPCTDGATKLKLVDDGSEGAVDPEKLVEN